MDRLHFIVANHIHFKLRYVIYFAYFIVTGTCSLTLSNKNV